MRRFAKELATKLKLRKSETAMAMAAKSLKSSSLEGNRSSGGSQRNTDFSEAFEDEEEDSHGLTFGRFFAEEAINQTLSE